MKIKCGTDIIEVNRIKEAIEKFEERFLNKVYTDLEITYCNSKETRFQNFAARFAAKEAVFKAISESLENKYDIKWTDIEIILDKNQRPIVNLKIEVKGLNQIDVSLSHIEKYATATCVAVFDD
ncbi:MAG: holo-ACP synthase [Clostridia bacterium]|nr:holo-ACP synthase [Clostridia bacterium]